MKNRKWWLLPAFGAFLLLGTGLAIGQLLLRPSPASGLGEMVLRVGTIAVVVMANALVERNLRRRSRRK